MPQKKIRLSQCFQANHTIVSPGNQSSTIGTTTLHPDAPTLSQNRNLLLPGAVRAVRTAAAAHPRIHGHKNLRKQKSQVTRGRVS